jgi:hypothetical protein
MSRRCGTVLLEQLADPILPGAVGKGLLLGLTPRLRAQRL